MFITRIETKSRGFRIVVRKSGVFGSGCWNAVRASQISRTTFAKAFKNIFERICCTTWITPAGRFLFFISDVPNSRERSPEIRRERPITRSPRSRNLRRCLDSGRRRSRDACKSVDGGWWVRQTTSGNGFGGPLLICRFPRQPRNSRRGRPFRLSPILIAGAAVEHSRPNHRTRI